MKLDSKMTWFSLLIVVLLVLVLFVQQGPNFTPAKDTRLSSFGGYSIIMSNEDKQRLHEGLLKPPDIFVSHHWHGGHVKTIKNAYPDKKIIIYRNCRKVNRHRTEQWASQGENRIAEYEIAVKNNWILKDSSGNYIYSTKHGQDYLLADLGNQGWQEFVADWIKFYIDTYGFDGVFLDNGLFCRVDEWLWSVSGKAINPRTGTYFTDEETISYFIQIHDKIRNKIGDNKLLICNGIWHGRRFFDRKEDYLRIMEKGNIDGFMSEGIFGHGGQFLAEDVWRKGVDFVVWAQDHWLNKGKIFVSHVDDVWNPPKGLTLEEWCTFVFASTLLGVKTETSKNNYFSVYGAWFKDYVIRLHNTDVGVPTEDYHIIEGTHVYMRKFSKALVIVNPTTVSYSLNLDKEHKTLDGQTISTVTLDDHTGVILLNISLTN